MGYGGLGTTVFWRPKGTSFCAHPCRDFRNMPPFVRICLK